MIDRESGSGNTCATDMLMSKDVLRTEAKGLADTLTQAFASGDYT